MTVATPALLAAYKRTVAGCYRSCPPDEMLTVLPPGPCIVSEKIDGETWFLRADGEQCTLQSPTGSRLEDIPLTEEAKRVLHGWRGIMAGELYAAVDAGRPRVFDLHTALGVQSNWSADRLRFAGFDLLTDGDTDWQRRPFSERLERLRQIIGDGGDRFHLAPGETATGPAEVAACYERIVAQGAAEGIVVHAADGRFYKVKPEITIDAAVVAYAGSESGVSDLLLALLKPDGVFQLIGRAKTGWSRVEAADLARRLAALTCVSSYRKVNDHGVLYRWVRPETVIEVKCNDLIAATSRDEPIRRMVLRYDDATGWSPLGPALSVSLINAVFRRIRDDKRPVRPDVRLEQVADLVPVAAQPSIDSSLLPVSELIRREVYTKATPRGLAVRKLVCWRSNKRETDPAYPAFGVFFTDFAPGRQQPLKTDLRVASTEERMHALVDDWLAVNIKRGWTAVATDRPVEPVTDAAIINPEPPAASYLSPHRRRLTIAFARSASPTFPIIRRRLDALARLGSLQIALDDKGREAWFELTIATGLVENAKRIENLLQIVRAWKTTEVSLDGELLGKHDLQDMMNRLEDARRCWLMRKKSGPDGCRHAGVLGCDRLRIRPSREFLACAGNDSPGWWTVGTFDGTAVRIDKAELKQRIDSSLNDGVRLCPHFDRESVRARVDELPEVIEADGERWITVYANDGTPDWIWPAGCRTPPILRTTKDNPWRSGGLNIRVGFGREDDRSVDNLSARPEVSALSTRAIPPTRYADIQGQDAAVEAVRDLIELPLRHADLFRRLGATPRPGGVILAGPPGTGKTLLARAVAGECGAHIEIVSGPELLSKWVGETEAALRTIFERAKARAPSVILFDEIDCLAASRGSADAQYQRSLVAQLLALLDGLEERGNVFVIATTNRPEDIDTALRRPGRFDRIVIMGPPDEPGRAANFRRYLVPLRLDPALDRDSLAADLAAQAPGITGADIAHLCHQAALLCVKDASRIDPPPENMAISSEHFRKALQACDGTRVRSAVRGMRPIPIIRRKEIGHDDTALLAVHRCGKVL